MRPPIRSAALALSLGCATIIHAQAAPEPFAVRRAILKLAVNFDSSTLSGAMTYEMENWTDAPVSTVSFLTHRLMEASSVTDGAGHPLPFTQDVKRFLDDPIRQVNQVIVTLPSPVAPNQRTTVTIDYAGYLTPSTEIGWLYVRDHVDTAFTVIRSDGLAFPIIGGLRSAANRRAPYPDFYYEADIRVPARFLVAAGGERTVTPNADGTTTWHYKSDGQSPFLNISIAPFDTVFAQGVSIFYFPADSLGARRLLASAKRALATYAEWFGPLHSDASVTITEIPNGWGSQGHPIGGILQDAATFRDSTQVAQLYHELSHFWNVVDTDAPSPRWNEGLASFLEQLTRERLDGWTGRADLEQRWIASLKRRVASDSTYRTLPFVDYGKAAVTGRSYSVGWIMFSALYDLIGPVEFNKLVGGFYQQHYSGATTADFAAFAKKTAPRDLSGFFDDWLFTTGWTKVLADSKSAHDIAVHYGAAP